MVIYSKKYVQKILTKKKREIIFFDNIL